jgi:hypothetical protein
VTVLIIIAFVALLFLATRLSHAGRLAAALQHFQGRTVEVLIWGAPPPATDGALVTLTSVKALGAGLHLYFQAGVGTSPLHLKVAQPSQARVTGDLLIIETARYMQWRRKNLPAVPGAPALTVTLHTLGPGATTLAPSDEHGRT